MGLIDEAIEFIEKLFEGNSDGHGVDHAMRVYHNAMIIAQTERCNKQIVALAALLHDADDHKMFHTEENANARGFLKEHGVTSKDDAMYKKKHNHQFSFTDFN